MGKMRILKAKLKIVLLQDNWQEEIDTMLLEIKPKEAIGSLFSCLLYGGELSQRAASALGLVISVMAKESPESARNIVRRFMWHMNEDSGNIGWGIPEAFAETLACSPLLFREFHKVLISYIVQTNNSNNYCDYAPLRSSCYWAVGRLVQVEPSIIPYVRPHLELGLADEDEKCRDKAKWAMAQFA